MAADLTDQLAEALRDVLAAVRGSNRLPETTMQAERALDAIRAARKKAEAALSAYAAARGVTPCEPCHRGNDKPEPTCTNRHQCWEPCGEMGKSEEHVRVGRQSTDGVKGMATVKESLTAGVPAFDLMQPCALGPGGNPLATECPRCKNPHHACDRNALGVTPCDGSQR
jgi:hypothetical protein